MKLMWTILVLICFYADIAQKCECARILGYFVVPSISHSRFFQPIWKELSLRGHQVTVITPDVLNDKSLTNLTEISTKFSYEIFVGSGLIQTAASNIDSFRKKKFTNDVMTEIVTAQLESEPVKKFLQDESKDFDLIVIEPIQPLPFALGVRYKAPVVAILSLAPWIEHHDALGNPVHPILNPDLYVQIDEESTFYQRLYSYIYNIVFRIYYNWDYLPKVDRIAKKYFGTDLPYLGDLIRNVSLVITNTNFLTSVVRPNVPKVVEVSNVLIKKNRDPLPSDLQELLDSSPEGVIYFSLGSNVKSANQTPDWRNRVLDTLSALPYKVLWKWEMDNLSDQPQNVFIRKWLPQQDILGHPNVKAFITQVGMQSVEEAIINEVPMVAMPFLADQFGNAKKITELGMAVTVNHEKLTTEEFLKAILEVAGNKRYKENVKKYHQLLIDQPIGGVDKAVWWIEYVLRHRGTPHLRNPALDLPFYQYHMLDVTLFLLFISCICFTFIIQCIRLLRNRKTKKLKSI